jgi:hypothetical protein
MRSAASFAFLLVLAHCGRIEPSAPATDVSPPSPAPTASGAASSDSSVSRDTSGFPVGTLTRCAKGSFSENGAFMSNVGFDVGASLTIAQSETQITATYRDANGTESAFEFDATTKDRATLIEPPSPLSGYANTGCILGLGSVAHTPAELIVSGGVLTYDANTVFLSGTGTLTDEAPAAPCSPISSAAQFWITCGKEDGDENGSRPSPDRSSSVVTFPVGDYGCSSEVATTYEFGTTSSSGVSGAKGVLTLEQSGSEVSARYTDDIAVSGTLRFTGTTGTSARTAPDQQGQTLQAGCDLVTDGSGDLPHEPEMLSVTAGSLTLIATKLFVSFDAAMTGSGSRCPGARKMGTLICEKR